MAKKVLIINEGFSSNLGDQAIKQSMEALLQKLGFETDFCYFTNPAVKQLPGYQYINPGAIPGSSGLFRAFKKKLLPFLSLFIYCRYFIKVKKQIKACLQNHNYHMVIIGGGQLINSSEKKALSFFAISLYQWAKAVKKNPTLSLYLAGVGVSGKFHAVEKYLYRKALSQAASIWVRDGFSQTSLTENFNIHSNLVPDVAFFQPGEFATYEKKNTALVGIYSYDEYSRKFETAEKNKAAYYKYWHTVVENFIAKKLEVLLFYTTESDAAETMAFQQYLQTRQLNIQVADIQSLEDLNRLYQNAAVVYSARMHALILGLKKGCKAEAYIISQKLKSFCEEYIDTGEKPEQLSDKVYNIFNDYFVNENLATTK